MIEEITAAIEGFSRSSDQGDDEQTVGKPIVQRTEIRIESNDRHVSELFFTPPGGKEQLALRHVYTRVGAVGSPKGIVLPKLPEPSAEEKGPYCVIARHRAKPGKADAYERRMLADISPSGPGPNRRPARFSSRLAASA